MSIRQNSLSRISSFNTFNKNSSKNSKQQYLSANPYYSPAKSRKLTNKKSFMYMQRLESLSSNKFKSYKLKRHSKISLNSSLIRQKRAKQKQSFYYPDKKLDLKSIIKNIKKQFVYKYNNIYHNDNLDFFYNNNNNDEYLLSDYYIINNLINKKRFHFTVLFKEYEILYNQQELLMKLYEKKERYIIMKYLLSFVYKYDELCYDANKEIDDKEKKEELIRTFHYITSSQYLYEHLLETDSFKGVKFLLKRINLNNKKAQYDYSYLDMAKNQVLSEENNYIINAIKAVNEFMNNRKFIEKRLIKNMPLKKVPNCLPNYYLVEKEFKISLDIYIKSKKFKKIRKAGDETLELIKCNADDNSSVEVNEKNNNLINQKHVLFNIDEKITENESSIGESDDNNIKIKKPKKENITNNFNSENNFYNILPSSLYEITEKENKVNKEEEEDLLANKNENNENYIDYKLMYDIFKSSKPNTRSTRDPEINDIENFLFTFPKDRNKSRFYDYEKYKINTNKAKDTKNINKKQNNLISPEIEVQNSNNKNQQVNIKSKGVGLQLGNNYKNKNKLEIEITSNSSKKNKLDILLNKKNNIRSMKDLFNNNYPILNQRKINKKFIKNNKIEPLLLSSTSKNNISSTIFSDINCLSKNISPSNQKDSEKGKIIFSNKNNFSNIKRNIDINNLKNNFSYDNKNNNKYGINTFKETKDFIIDLKQYYNRIKSRPKFLLKSFVSFNNKSSNESQKLNFSPKKRIFSANNHNSPNNKNLENYYLYANDFSSNIKNMSNYIKNEFIKQKKKESKNITLEQIIKNSILYSSELL